jgi:predicted anti-sigma-YlaC factor YlaD
MNCPEMIVAIHQFVDGELSPESEPMLFTHLSNCTDCRDEFKLLGLIRNEVLSAQEEVPDALEKKIYETIGEHRYPVIGEYFTRKMPAYFLYAALVCAIVSSVFMYTEIISMQHRIGDKEARIEIQEAQIKNLWGSMPAVKVRATVINPDLISSNKYNGGSL